VTLPEDPDVLVILLSAIYGHLGRIPKKLSCDQLLHLVILCEDYDSIGALREFWDGWINSVEPGRCNLETITSRLQITCTLGHTHYGAAVLVALLSRLRVVGGRRRCSSDFEDWNRLVFNGDLGDEKFDLDAHFSLMRAWPGSWSGVPLPAIYRHILTLRSNSRLPGRQSPRLVQGGGERCIARKSPADHRGRQHRPCLRCISPPPKVA